MNTKCGLCSGKGVIQRDGKKIGNRQPFTLICSSCNGVGHHSIGGGGSGDDYEEALALAALSRPVLA